MPPTAYGASFSGGVNRGSGKSATDIADLTLPPGSYILHAVANAVKGTAQTLACSLYDDANVSGAGNALASGAMYLEDGTSLPILGTIVIPSTINSDTVRLYCGTNSESISGVAATYVALPVTWGSPFLYFSNTMSGGTAGTVTYNLQQNKLD